MSSIQLNVPRVVPRCAVFILCTSAVAAKGVSFTPNFLQFDVAQDSALVVQFKDQNSSINLRTEIDVENFDVDELKDKLGVFNTSLDKVDHVVHFVNDTAMELLSEVATVIGAFQAKLPKLQMAANAIDELVPWAANFVDVANRTCDSFVKMLSAMPATVAETLDKIMPSFRAVVGQILGKFVDAAEQVVALQNSTAGLRQIAESNVTAKPLGGNAKGTIVQRNSSKKKMDKQRKKDIVWLMRSRALHSNSKSTSATVDSAIAAKGLSTCSKAKKSIMAANSSFNEYVRPVHQLANTGLNLLNQILYVASSGLDNLNSTVNTALEPGTLTIPPAILKPIKKGLSTAMIIVDQLVDTVNEALQQIEKKIKKSEKPVAVIYEVVNELQAAADQACDT